MVPCRATPLHIQTPVNQTRKRTAGQDSVFPLLPYSSIRYRCDGVRRNRAFPETAGEAMRPSSR